MNRHITQKRLASVRDTAEFYGISLSTLWRWHQQGLIPDPIRIGRRTFWEPETLEAHLTQLRAK